MWRTDFKWDVPGGLVVLHPWIEGWVCRSMLLAGGSILPRQHCSLAVLRAERLGLLWLQEAEMPLDLECKTKCKFSMTSTLKLLAIKFQHTSVCIEN